MIIKDLLKQGLDFLEHREGALLDVELILAFTLGVEKEYLIVNSDEEIDDGLKELFFHYLGRVREGEPIAYIIQNKEFYGLDFYVDSRVLIPRPETERLVEKVIEFLENKFDGTRRLRVLDVGTGSGNIAVSVAKYFFDQGLDIIEEVRALEFDPDAAEVARINVEQHGVDHLVNVFQSDLLEAVDDEESFDVIVANLPYIGQEKNRFVSASAEKYEPNIALFGGKEGLELYNKMFQDMIARGICSSFVAGEFGFAQREDMGGLLSKYFDQKWEIEKDLAGIDRLFVITP